VKSGFGYSDVENGVKMSPESVIRIASISKSMTMAMMGRLMEEGQVDIDAPVQKYLPQFPTKTYEGQPVSRIHIKYIIFLDAPSFWLK
jgi:serine beta-lactamase-like protein LACTB